MCTEAEKKAIRESISKKNEDTLRKEYGIVVKKAYTVGDIKDAKSFTATFNPAKKYKKIG